MRPTGDPSLFGLGDPDGGAAVHALTTSTTPSPSAATPADLRTDAIQRHPYAHRLIERDGFERWN
jgi:hypothetical protein